MTSFEYVITDVHGIHARPATDLFKLSKNYSSKVTAAKGDRSVPFKGVMGLMALGAKQGDTVKFTFDGPDEAEESAAFEEFLKANL